MLCMLCAQAPLKNPSFSSYCALYFVSISAYWCWCIIQQRKPYIHARTDTKYFPAYVQQQQQQQRNNVFRQRREEQHIHTKKHRANACTSHMNGRAHVLGAGQ